jgi:hypothetical protein
MNLTKKQLQSLIEAAYNLGYDECANSAGYCGFVLSGMIDPKIHKHPKNTPKSKLLAKILQTTELNDTVPMIKSSRKRRFFFHFNKPMSQRTGTPKMNVHFNKSCRIVDEIDCQVLCKSKINKRQPRVVMQGFADKLIFFQENGKDKVIIKNLLPLRKN